MRTSLISLVMCCLLPAAAPPARAQDNPGQADLDQAFDAKLKAKDVRALGDVIGKCESARQKGLDEEHQKFADQLLAGTLVERGLYVAQSLFEADKPDLHWPQIREFALTDLEKAVRIDAQQGEALYTIARLQLLPGGDAQRARTALDQAIEVSADSPDVRAKALAVRAGMLSDKKQRRADLDEAVRISPSDPTAIFARGLLLADLGQTEAALADFDKTLELKPDHAPVYEARGLVLLREKKYDEALTAFDRASELAPHEHKILIQKAQVLALQHNYDAALRVLDRAVELAPDEVDVLLLRSAVYEEKGDKARALVDMDEVLKKRPNLPLAVHLRTRLLAGEGRLETAIAELEKFRKDNPQDMPSLLELAMLYAARQEHDLAIQTYGQVLDREPDNFAALRGRGDALLGVGRHAEAVADYERALRLEAQDSGLLNNFAWVLATSPDDHVRNGRRALRMAADACKLTQYKQAHILSTLAAAHAETGDFKAAVEWSQKAVAAGNKDEKEGLAKERESYQAGKPWRERQLPEARKTTGKRDEPPAGEAPPPAKKPRPEKAKQSASEKSP